MSFEKAEKRKKIIFSNINHGYNCSEECSKMGDCDCDNMTLSDERINMNVNTDGRILAIADVGKWNGRVSGYKVLPNNIKSILSSDCDYAEWYGDGHNIRAIMHHHDGTNYVEYRVIREDKNIQAFLDKIYNQKPITRQMINYYTKSLYPYVAKVYGW